MEKSIRPVVLLGLFDTAIATARCFNGTGINVYGLDYNESHLGFHSSIIKSSICPDPKRDEKAWLNFIIDWFKKINNKCILIPTSDEFATLCAKYKTELDLYSAFLLPDFEVMHQIIERDLQFIAAQKAGSNVPYFIKGPVKMEDINAAGFELPVAIKPLNATEWKKVFTVKGYLTDDKDEIKNILDDLNSKNVRYLVQQNIAGDNTNNFEVNSLYLPDGSIIQHTIQKLRQYPDRFGTATCIQNVSKPEIEKMAETLVKKLGLFGFTNLEFKYNSNDKLYYYIETNTRVWLQVNFSKKVGINFPALYYNYLTDNFKDQKYTVTKYGKWVDFLPDLLYWSRCGKENNLSFFKLLRSWSDVCSTNLLSITDPKPFLKELRLFNRLKKIFKTK